MKDFETWLKDCNNKIFRMLEYRRIGFWTPFEMDQKYTDQSEYKDAHYSFVKIKEAVKLPDGDVLLGVQFIYDCEDLENKNPQIYYKKLSQLELSYDPEDRAETW